MTTQIKHTPGPWRVAPAHGTLCAWRIESDIGQCVAFVAQTIGNNQLENDRAKLIAAAPELLGALQAILRAHDSKNNGAVMGEAVLCRYFAEMAREAIAHATGE